jgi:hypothetical protein
MRRRAQPAPSSNGDVLSTAIPVGELLDYWIKMVIYGRNRVGKTTLACCFGKPLLLIAFEPNQTGGATSVKLVNGVTLVKVTNSQQGCRLAQALADNPLSNWEEKGGILVPMKDKNHNPVYQGLPWITHVLDTVTSYQDCILQEICKFPKIPEQLDWGLVSEDQYRMRSERTRESLRPFLNLPVHTVFCAQEKDHNPPKESRIPNPLTRGMQQESFFAADLGGATVKWLHDSCDYIAQLYQDKEVIQVPIKIRLASGEEKEKITHQETGKIVRRLRTMYHPNYAAGFRSAKPSSVPEYIEAVTPEEMYNKVIQVIEGKYAIPKR